MSDESGRQSLPLCLTHTNQHLSAVYTCKPVAQDMIVSLVSASYPGNRDVEGTLGWQDDRRYWADERLVFQHPAVTEWQF